MLLNLSNAHILQLLDTLGFSNHYYGNPAKLEYYPYVSFDRIHFIKLIQRFARPGDSFLDVGCGLGDKLFLARSAYDQWDSVTGVEVSEEFFSIAKFLLTDVNVKLINQDALSLDYSKYTFIYMFRPIRKQALYEQLLERIVNTCKDYTMFIEAYSHFSFRGKDYDGYSFIIREKTLIPLGKVYEDV